MTHTYDQIQSVINSDCLMRWSYMIYMNPYQKVSTVDLKFSVLDDYRFDNTAEPSLNCLFNAQKSWWVDTEFNIGYSDGRRRLGRRERPPRTVGGWKINKLPVDFRLASILFSSRECRNAIWLALSEFFSVKYFRWYAILAISRSSHPWRKSSRCFALSAYRFLPSSWRSSSSRKPLEIPLLRFVIFSSQSAPKMLFWVHLNWFIETRKRALYHESLILNESLWFFSNGFRCFPFQKHFRTQLMLLFCFIPKKSLTATILHVFIMSYSGRCHVIFHPWTDCVHVHFCTTSPPLTASPLRTVEVDMV